MSSKFGQCALIVAALIGSARADHPTKKPEGDGALVPLIENLGDLEHQVSTKDPLAQQYFNQGLRLIFAFNHDEAIRAFRAAAVIDPNSRDGALGNRDCARTELQPGGRQGTERKGLQSPARSTAAVLDGLAGRGRLHRRCVEALFRVARCRPQSARPGLCRRDARAGAAISRRFGRGRTVCRVADELKALGSVDRRRPASAGHARSWPRSKAC